MNDKIPPLSPVMLVNCARLFFLLKRFACNERPSDLYGSSSGRCGRQGGLPRGFAKLQGLIIFMIS